MNEIFGVIACDITRDCPSQCAFLAAQCSLKELHIELGLWERKIGYKRVRVTIAHVGVVDTKSPVGMYFYVLSRGSHRGRLCTFPTHMLLLLNHHVLIMHIAMERQYLTTMPKTANVACPSLVSQRREVFWALHVMSLASSSSFVVNALHAQGSSWTPSNSR